MISILALKNLAQYQFLANSYALRNIFQIFAAAAIEFYPANSRHFQALVCPGAAVFAVECNSLLQRGPYRGALDVRPDLIRGGIDGPHDLHIPLCLKLLDRLGLVGGDVVGIPAGARQVHTHGRAAAGCGIHKICAAAQDDLVNLALILSLASGLTTYQLQCSQYDVIRQAFVFPHVCIPPLIRNMAVSAFRCQDLRHVCAAYKFLILHHPHARQLSQRLPRRYRRRPAARPEQRCR
nr:MAG TPA: hypothetical protein [Caudoviricetes sp.]